MNVRSVCRTLLIASLFALLCGCWDVRDINKRYLPVVMGISEGKSATYSIILQIPSVSGKTQILEQEADSISKALDLIRTKAEKHVDLLHLRLFLISERMAKTGLDDVMDYAIRANDISIKGMMAIVTGDFEKTLHHEISPTPEISSYDYFSEESGWTPNVSIVRIWEAFRGSQSYTKDLAYPLIHVGTDTLYDFEGSAIMRKNKMVGALSPDETLVYNIFLEKYTGGTIEAAKDTSVIIKKARVRHRKEWTASGPKLKSAIYLDVAVSENKKNLPNHRIAEEIQEMIDKKGDEIIRKMRALKTDLLGTGQLFRSQMSERQIRDWKDVWFPRLTFDISVKVNIRDNIYFKEKIKS
ncbi:Ger(x)C family spore germination protein [Cohnella nanjingensis]|uniref:Ger(X)C family spore germination protein n=1 Tax=Cohnella nanjingensis TaxID=1387779 RepID=A0A7X0VEG5_9BACL|nr:Ger(x)C family spore germination protein [Cohnella nanjingensis]MBB6669519.1 Ger(x)C family spore germination protein [Cohnella nanjingensis]